MFVDGAAPKCSGNYVGNHFGFSWQPNCTSAKAIFPTRTAFGGSQSWWVGNCPWAIPSRNMAARYVGQTGRNQFLVLAGTGGGQGWDITGVSSRGLCHARHRPLFVWLYRGDSPNTGWQIAKIALRSGAILLLDRIWPILSILPKPANNPI